MWDDKFWLSNFSYAIGDTLRAEPRFLLVLVGSICKLSFAVQYLLIPRNTLLNVILHCNWSRRLVLFIYLFLNQKTGFILKTMHDGLIRNAINSQLAYKFRSGWNRFSSLSRSCILLTKNEGSHRWLCTRSSLSMERNLLLLC